MQVVMASYSTKRRDSELGPLSECTTVLPRRRARHRVLQGSNGQRGLHLRVQRVRVDPSRNTRPSPRSGRASLGIGCSVISVGHSAFGAVAVRSRTTGLPVQAPLLREDRPDTVVPEQALYPVLARQDALPRQFIGDKPIPECRVVRWMSSAAWTRRASTQSRSVARLVFHRS
jgi:hypothetical protein